MDVDDDDSAQSDEAELESDAEEQAMETAACPSCGRSIDAGSEQCPHCRHFILSSEIDGQKPRWLVATALLCVVLIFIVWVVKSVRL